MSGAGNTDPQTAAPSGGPHTAQRIGFTGTRDGMTDYQREAVREILNRYPFPREFHHGDCMGSDAEAAEIAYRLSYKVLAHPPDNASHRAFTAYGPVYPVKPYLIRNHDIVDDTEVLVATPKGFVEELRSGTWATIRYAHRIGREVIIVYPSQQ